jgi:hypothetical protein
MAGGEHLTIRVARRLSCGLDEIREFGSKTRLSVAAWFGMADSRTVHRHPETPCVLSVRARRSPVRKGSAGDGNYTEARQRRAKDCLQFLDGRPARTAFCDGDDNPSSAGANGPGRPGSAGSS